MSQLKLYSFEKSGHAHRARLMLSLLQLDAEIIDVDLAAGEHKGEEFLAINAFGQVPVLADGELIISDSNAILIYLVQEYAAANSHWYPQDAAAQAHIQRFLSLAAGSLAQGPATARLVTLFGAPLDQQAAIDSAHQLFAVYEDVLSRQDFLASDQVSIADIANYSYIKHAPEGGVALDNYPHIQRWLARIQVLDGFVPMSESKVGLCA